MMRFMKKTLSLLMAVVLLMASLIIRFVWTRGGNEVADEVLLQIVVTDDLMIYAIDATENGIDADKTDPSEEASELTVPLDMPELAIEGGILIGAYYHCSGDENGNIFSTGIDWTEDGTLVLTVEEKDCHSDPLTVSRSRHRRHCSKR